MMAALGLDVPPLAHMATLKRNVASHPRGRAAGQKVSTMDDKALRVARKSFKGGLEHRLEALEAMLKGGIPCIHGQVLQGEPQAEPAADARAESQSHDLLHSKLAALFDDKMHALHASISASLDAAGRDFVLHHEAITQSLATASSQLDDKVTTTFNTERHGTTAEHFDIAASSSDSPTMLFDLFDDGVIDDGNHVFSHSVAVQTDVVTFVDIVEDETKVTDAAAAVAVLAAVDPSDSVEPAKARRFEPAKAMVQVPVEPAKARNIGPAKARVQVPVPSVSGEPEEARSTEPAKARAQIPTPATTSLGHEVLAHVGAAAYVTASAATASTCNGEDPGLYSASGGILDTAEALEEQKEAKSPLEARNFVEALLEARTPLNSKEDLVRHACGSILDTADGMSSWKPGAYGEAMGEPKDSMEPSKGLRPLGSSLQCKPRNTALRGPRVAAFKAAAGHATNDGSLPETKYTCMAMQCKGESEENTNRDIGVQTIEANFLEPDFNSSYLLCSDLGRRIEAEILAQGIDTVTCRAAICDVADASCQCHLPEGAFGEVSAQDLLVSAATLDAAVSDPVVSVEATISSDHLMTACVRGALCAANLAAVLRAAPGMDAAIAADAVASLACVKRDAIESVLELVQAGLTCKAKANAWIRQIQALGKPASLPPPSIQQTQWLAKQGAAAL